MKYTVCFLFTDNGERVLLQKKNRTQYSGQFNGVGGKIEPGETPLEGARREIRGKTGADVQDLIWLGTLSLPKDRCLLVGGDSMGYELSFFAGTVEDTKAVSQPPGETEPLLWLLTRHVIGGLVDTAGGGNVEYFVSKDFRAVAERAPASDKTLYPDLVKLYQAIANNLAREAGFLRHSAFYTRPSMTGAMNEAVTVIRSLATNRFDKDQFAHYKMVATNLAEEAKVFEEKAINSCADRYAFSSAVSTMKRAAAAIWELIKFVN